ncbi:nucleotidyltransferase family protein [Chitinophaga sp.]|uniref:nucleotidyltransferase family protein n=1 Tax=Chitinophaga sp. TaxID=1869181 RepID=UPI0031E08AB0
MSQTGIIILAAGTASRMGKPKQLIQYEGNSFIRRITMEAVREPAHPVVVVLGAYSDAIVPEIQDLKIHIAINHAYHTGMAGSLTTGLNFLLEKYNLAQVIFVVADQPFVTADLFAAMINCKTVSGKGIVACSYSGTTGTPVLFDGKYFPALRGLTREEGAKRIVHQNKDDLATVVFEAGAIDIDTAADYNRIIFNKGNDHA